MAKRKRTAAAPNNVEQFPNKNGLRLRHIEPKTANQSLFCDAYYRGDHIFVHGFAGTGKTFLALALALKDVLVTQRYEQILIIRSAVPTRDIGHMPGNAKEKTKMYELPYELIVNDLTQHEQGYNVMKTRKMIDFISTSFVRGLTLENTVVIVDEASNCSMHELDSLITRMGPNSKIIFCGDFRQTDLAKENDKRGFLEFMDILKSMPEVSFIEFGVEDIVRSAFVKSYILAKHAHQSAQPISP